MIKGLIFDFGGTLDTDGIHWSVKFWEAYQSYVKSLSLKSFNKAYVYSENLMPFSIKQNDTFLNTLIKQVTLQIQYLKETDLLDEPTSSKLIMDICNYCYKDVLNNINKVIQVLENLKDDFQLALVSNFYGNIETVLTELKIHNFFRSVIDSAIVNVRKPDPAIFNIAIEALELKPSECVVIGDSYDRDIIPAKRLGCKTIWLEGKSWFEPGETSCADYVIKSLIEFPRLLKILVLKNVANKN